MAFRETLHRELVLLDVEGRAVGDVFEPVARAIVEHLVRDGQMDGAHAGAALAELVRHLGSAKRVDHDDALREHRRLKKEQALKKSDSSLRSNKSGLSLGNLFRSASSGALDASVASRAGKG